MRRLPEVFVNDPMMGNLCERPVIDWLFTAYTLPCLRVADDGRYLNAAAQAEGYAWFSPHLPCVMLSRISGPLWQLLRNEIYWRANQVHAYSAIFGPAS